MGEERGRKVWTVGERSSPTLQRNLSPPPALDRWMQVVSQTGGGARGGGMTESHPATHKLILMPSGRQGQVPHGTDLLAAARSLGVELESICGGRQTAGKSHVAAADD